VVPPVTPPVPPTDLLTTKPGDPPKPPEAFVPLTVEALKLPEGLQVDKELAASFVALVNEHKLPPAVQAQLVELQSKSMQALSGQDSENWNKTQEEWTTQIKADPEYGGAKYEATIADVGVFMTAFADDEVRQALDITGAGNHPAIIKMLAKAAKVVKEGGYVKPTVPGEAPKMQADIMYPNQGKV
jgi:hypothetical protein